MFPLTKIFHGEIYHCVIFIGSKKERGKEDHEFWRVRNRSTLEIRRLL